MSILIDVSNDGEFGFLMKYMSKFNRVPRERCPIRIESCWPFLPGRYRVIVDIGAFDGLMSSNSFNLIQAGWDAVIVEPYPPLMEKAKHHLERYVLICLFLLLACATKHPSVYFASVRPISLFSFGFLYLFYCSYLFVRHGRFNSAEAQHVSFAPVAVAEHDGEAFLNVFENTGLQNSLLNTSMGARTSSVSLMFCSFLSLLLFACCCVLLSRFFLPLL